MLQPFQLKNLADQKAYDEIIAIYQTAEERKGFTEWDWVHVMNAFYEKKQYETCLQVYKEFHRLFPDSKRLDDRMCWSLYHVHLKGVTVNKDNADEFRRRGDFILSHCSDSVYTPKWLVTRLLIKAIKNGQFGQTVDYAAILKYLNSINPSTLPTKENSLEVNGKTTRNASDRESWYAEKCKAELKTGNYEACIETANRALSDLSAFHSNNDSWFRYRRARAYMALGQSDTAAREIQGILNRGFCHWCFHQILFEIARDEGKADEALLSGCKCALADPSHEMRVSFYEDFADFLARNNYEREAQLHRRLVLLLRTENEWKLKDSHLSWQFSEDIASMDKKDVLRALTAFWRKVRDSSRTFYTGKIRTLLPSGQDGFIDGDEGSYYFRMNDIRHGRNKAVVDTKVRFALENRLDRKKNVVKPAAVDIEVLE